MNLFIFAFLFGRMEPFCFSMVVAPHDIIGDLIQRRIDQLESTYPHFRQAFLQLERNLKEQEETLLRA